MTLDDAAAQAWKMMQGEPPMIPHAALDWIREQADTDNVESVAKALFRAAAKWLADLQPMPPMTLDSDRSQPNQVSYYISGGAFGLAEVPLSRVKTLSGNYARRHQFHPDEVSGRAKQWGFWCHTATEVITLLRRVQDLT